MKQKLYIDNTDNSRIKNLDQTWVVYLHYEGDQIVYCGSGQVHRAFQFIKRDLEHENWMIDQALKYNGLPFVEIWMKTKNYQEARWVESRIIAEYSPKYNKTLQKLTQNMILDGVERANNGESYESISKDFGIYRNNLRLHLLSEFARKAYDLP